MDIEGVYRCSRCLRQIESEEVCPFCGYDHRKEKNREPALEAGTLLKGRYQLGSVVGSGGFGITYAAWDETLQTAVAVKEYFPEDLATRDTEYSDEVDVPAGSGMRYRIGLDHFIREARVLAMLQESPGVVRVQDCFEENNTAYLVMEYVRGVTLERFARERRLGGEELFAMLEDPIRALCALHRQGVLHRDITPSNLLVQEDGRVKLIDFGSAARMDRGQTMIVATQWYAPVEQYGAKGGLGAWTDVYGLCATIYAVLTGNPPQDSISRSHRDELVPIGRAGVRLKKYQERAIMAGLEVRPEKRTRSMEEFRCALYHLPMPEEVKRRERILRRAAAGAAVLLSAALLFAVNVSSGFPLGGGLLFSLRADGFHIVGETRPRKERELPKSKLGIPVCAIEDGAFAGDAVLELVSVPGSVRSVGSMVFSSCASLETAILGEGLVSVGDYAFAECGDLRSVYLPDSLETLAENAFDRDSGYLTAWGSGSARGRELSGRAGLAYAVREDYEVADDQEGGVLLAAYRGAEGELILPSAVDGKPVTGFVQEGGQLFSVQEEICLLQLPEQVQEIPEGTFQGIRGYEEYPGGKLKKAVLNEGLQTIGDSAFAESGLEEAALPDGLKGIGNYAFADSELKSVELPASVEEIGDGAFCGSLLEKVSAPGCPDGWGKMVFASCERLREAELPEGMEEIPWRMFADCTALASLRLPDGLKVIREAAFSGCDALEYVELPEGAGKIEARAFEDCVGLKYAAIPASVTEIDGTAFDGCRAGLVIGGVSGSRAQAFAREQGLLFDDWGLWSREAQITDPGTVDLQGARQEELVLPSYDETNRELVRTVELSGNRADIEQVRLPLFAETIGEEAFSADRIEGYGPKEKRLALVEIPATLRVIGKKAFYGCENLEAFEFPAGLEKIEDSAFEGCTGLAEVTLPESLLVLGEHAFRFCSGLEKVTVLSRELKIREGTFQNCPGMTLCAYEGSSAAAYAREYGIPLEILEER